MFLPIYFYCKCSILSSVIFGLGYTLFSLTKSPGFPGSASGKEPVNAGDTGDVGSIPGSGRPPGGGNGNPLQYSCLENPTDRETCWATVHRVTKSQTRLKWLSTVTSHVWIFATPWPAACQASLSIIISLSLLKLTSTESVIPSNHPSSVTPFYLALNFSQHQGLFQWVSSSHQVAKVLELQHQSFQWISGLRSFRIDWFDLAVQETLKSLLQHHSLKASVLQYSAFFMVQLSHPFITTRKTMTLTRRTFVGKVMSLLFITLSGFVTAFPPRRNHLLLSWLQSPSTVILEPRKIKSVTVFTFSRLFAMKW